jgi:hypothetical protein
MGTLSKWRDTGESPHESPHSVRRLPQIFRFSPKPDKSLGLSETCRMGVSRPNCRFHGRHPYSCREIPFPLGIAVGVRKRRSGKRYVHRSLIPGAKSLLTTNRGWHPAPSCRSIGPALCRPAFRDGPGTARLPTERESKISDFEAQAEPTWRAALA